jgi:hypothetical protein
MNLPLHYDILGTSLGVLDLIRWECWLVLERLWIPA